MLDLGWKEKIDINMKFGVAYTDKDNNDFQGLP
jgi:hypothetical protein